MADLLGAEHPLPLALGDHGRCELYAFAKGVSVKEVGGALAIRDGALEDEAIDGVFLICGVLHTVLARSVLIVDEERDMWVEANLRACRVAHEHNLLLPQLT